MRELLAIVPARGGSQGIIGKNLRPLNGQPLILHTLSTLGDSHLVTRLIVSTDSEEIASFCRLRGYEILLRDPSLATPDSTLSEVAVALVEQLDWDGDVGVFQPTSPLRTVESVNRAIDDFRSSDCDSLASVVRQDHLYWFDESGDLSNAVPLFKERLNRQYGSHGVLKETGSIQLVTSSVLLASRSLVTDNHLLFETDPTESVDIDSPMDLFEARSTLERGKVVFRIHANREVGRGHLNHCLVLAEELQHHDIAFLLRDCDIDVEQLLDAKGWDYEIEVNLDESLRRLRSARSTVLVNDVLDTTLEDVLPAKSLGYHVINIEDLGEGARYADWVVNALYASDDTTASVTGGLWTTFRPEFHALPPKEIRETPETVLVTFGGADPAGLTQRFASALAESLTCEIRVVVGPSADSPDLPPNATVLESISSMAEEMMRADVVITSAGRTVYEAAATGTPVVVVAQNAREATHSHLSLENGAVFLGIGTLVDAEYGVHVVQRLLSDTQLRREMSDRLRTMVDGRGGRRIAHRIDALIQEL